MAHEGEAVLRITCRSRNHALDCYYMIAPDKQAAALDLVCFYLPVDLPVLLFVAGKQEISVLRGKLHDKRSTT